jgi:hypothetical protein
MRVFHAHERSCQPRVVGSSRTTRWRSEPRIAPAGLGWCESIRSLGECNIRARVERSKKPQRPPKARIRHCTPERHSRLATIGVIVHSPRAREEKSPGLKVKTSIGFVRDIFNLRQ